MPDSATRPAPADRRVICETRDEVAVVLLSNAPVNVLDTATRADLLEALVDAERSRSIRAVVIMGYNGFFSAGADLGEFDNGESFREPSLQETVIGFIESMRTPVVAALNGYALGGGLELALACHYRIGVPDTRLALPECTVGLLPGAGGTQLLPRAIGMEAAADMVLTGAARTLSELAETGLIDAVVTEELDVTAVEFARSVASRALPRLCDLPSTADPSADLMLLGVLAKRASRGPHASARHLALEALEAAVNAPDADVGRKKEFELFRRALGDATSAAQRYRMLAERRAMKKTGDPRGRPANAVVVGAGTMGKGIATALINNGIAVTLHDASVDGLAAAARAVRSSLDRAVERGRVTAAEAEARKALLSTSETLGCAADTDLVIEAIYESPEAKTSIFRELGAIAQAGAVLATNTSTLDIDPIAKASGRAADVVGIHFFSPADVMKLVEVIPGARTSASTISAATELARTVGKLPILAGNAPGFIGNRIIDSYLRQALQLLLQGASVTEIDSALVDFGMAMGPFHMMDLVGNDILWHARAASPNALDTTLDWSIADQLSEAGWLGRKSGAGWYEYGEGNTVNPAAATLVAEHARTQAIPQRTWAREELVDRCVTALVVEGTRALEQRIASSGTDIDLVLMNGYGFPAGLGGPMFHADTVGLVHTLAAIRAHHADTGEDPFWETPALLIRLASVGGRISTWRTEE